MRWIKTCDLKRQSQVNVLTNVKTREFVDKLQGIFRWYSVVVLFKFV